MILYGISGVLLKEIWQKALRALKLFITFGSVIQILGIYPKEIIQNM